MTSLAWTTGPWSSSWDFHTKEMFLSLFRSLKELYHMNACMGLKTLALVQNWRFCANQTPFNDLPKFALDRATFVLCGSCLIAYIGQNSSPDLYGYFLSSRSWPHVAEMGKAFAKQTLHQYLTSFLVSTTHPTRHPGDRGFFKHSIKL